MFGAGKVLDAYYGAFQIPNLLRDLFAEGVAVDRFHRPLHPHLGREGDAPAWKLANLTLSAMVFIIGIVSVVGIFAAPLIVEVTNFGFHNVPGKFELAVSLTRVLFPFILFVSLAAAVMGMLNARFIFGIPASASTVFNIVSVIAGVALAFVFDGQARADLAASGVRRQRCSTASASACCWAAWRSSACSCRRCSSSASASTGSWQLGDPRLKELWSLMWPSVIAGSLSSGERAGQRHLRLGDQRRPLVAELRLSADAAADRPVRRLAGDGHVAGCRAQLRPRRAGRRSAARCRARCG